MRLPALRHWPVRIHLTVSLRQTEKPPVPRPVTDWFCVVDRAPATTRNQCTLADGSVVLGFSATRSDAAAVADLEGMSIVPYGQLTESDQATLLPYIDRWNQHAE